MIGGFSTYTQILVFDRNIVQHWDLFTAIILNYLIKFLIENFLIENRSVSKFCETEVSFLIWASE